jgi:glutamate synthase domain-containing protein 1
LNFEVSMCGILGFLDKRGGHEQPVGRTLMAMLQALSCRGPDSAGVALFGPRRSFWVVQMAPPEDYEKAQAILEHLENLVKKLPPDETFLKQGGSGRYIRLELGSKCLPDADSVEQLLVNSFPGCEVVSVGRQLEIIKQVGSPTQLEQYHQISKKVGSHGIGHTRLSTESRVDLSHSQPFWAHAVPDLATVHNGHITNYHKLRRQYEQRGYRFYTENDSEVIGVYLRDRMVAGLSLQDALGSSLDDFDGSFSYLAASGDCLAYVKDRFGFKPLMVAETDEFVAIATEEVALRKALGRHFVSREPAPGTMGIWSVRSSAGVCP